MPDCVYSDEAFVCARVYHKPNWQKEMHSPRDDLHLLVHILSIVIIPNKPLNSWTTAVPHHGEDMPWQVEGALVIGCSLYNPPNEGWIYWLSTIYSSSTVRRRAFPLVRFTFSCCARSTIDFLFSEETLCAISAQNFLQQILAREKTMRESCTNL